MSYMCVLLCWNYCSFYQCVGPFSKPYTWWQELRRISTCCLQKTPVVSNFALIPKSSHPFCVFNVHWAVPSVLIFVFEQQRPGRWWLLALASASRVFLQDEMIAAHWTMNKERNCNTATQPDCTMYKWIRNNRLPIAGSTFSDGHHVWKVLSGSSSLLQVEWISFSRSSYIKIFWDEIYRVYKKSPIAKKNPNQNWVLWGQICPWIWLGSAWSC